MYLTTSWPCIPDQAARTVPPLKPAADSPSAAGPPVSRGTALAGEWMERSPWLGLIGVELLAVEPDVAEVGLPFRAELTTSAELVSGGAIVALIETAATVAAWSGAATDGLTTGATAGLHVVHLAAKPSAALRARAEVLRRGRSLCFSEVSVFAGDLRVAHGTVTYRFLTAGATDEDSVRGSRGRDPRMTTIHR